MRLIFTLSLFTLLSNQTLASIDLLRRTRIKPSILEDRHAIAPIALTRSLGSDFGLIAPRIKTFPWEELERLQELAEHIQLSLNDLQRLAFLYIQSIQLKDLPGFDSFDSKSAQAQTTSKPAQHMPPGILSAPNDAQTQATNQYLIEPTSNSAIMTLVLDFDETLAWNRNPNAPARLRPGVREMLESIRSLSGTEIVLWTASSEEIIREALEQTGIRPYFHHVIWRDSRWFTEGTHFKDLRLLGRDLNRVIIFDNSPYCVKLHKENALLVHDFHGDTSSPDHTMFSIANLVRYLHQHMALTSIPAVLKHIEKHGCFDRFTPEIHPTWLLVDIRLYSPEQLPPRGTFSMIPKDRKLL